MTLYGYDASTYNSVQASDNWLAWFNLTSVRGVLSRPCEMQVVNMASTLQDSSYLLGLINTIYAIGAIISGWFVGGPLVSESRERWTLNLNHMEWC